MYNEEIKTRFIKQYTMSIKVANSCEGLFNRTQPYEEKLGMDICAMSVEDTARVFDSIIGVRSRSRVTKFAILKEYSRWCMRNGIPGATENIMHTNLLGFESMRMTMVTNPVHLQKCLDDLFDKEEDNTLDNVFRCYYWIVFGGFAVDERIMQIKSSDIHLETMSFVVDGHEYPIYREAIKAFRAATQNTTIYYENAVGRNGSIRSRASGDLLLRGLAQPSLTSFRVSLSRKNKLMIDSGKSNMQIDRYKIYLSGIFYRMYEVERAGLPVSFRKLAEEFVNGREYTWCGTLTLNSKTNEIERGYMNDYIRWKYAFEMN